MSFIVASFRPANHVVAAANHRSKRFGQHGTVEEQVGGWFLLSNLLNVTRRSSIGPAVLQTAAAACSGSVYNAAEVAAQLKTLRASHQGSDCMLLAHAYRAWGASFTSRVIGEFAVVVVDFTQQQLVLSSDTFATHPLWSAVWRDEAGLLRIAATSIESSLKSLGAPDHTRVEARPNQVRVISFAGIELSSQPIKADWDLRQHKMTLQDWYAAFERAFSLRTEGLLKPQDAMSLSSGHDSGALLLALSRQGFRLRCYNIPEMGNSEKLRRAAQIVKARAPLCLRGLRTLNASWAAQAPIVENAGTGMASLM